MSSEKITVLIVDDIAETRENIRKLLQFEADVEVVGAARSGAEAIELARDTGPDVVLMDINMPDMDGITATETIRKIAPNTQIVILSVQGDPNYMRRAMLAGARDFLTKPPTIDELVSAIRRAGQMAHEEKAKRPSFANHGGLTGPLHMSVPSATTGKVITVFSPKGGAGSTTIAANLAVTLHNAETQVVLVDGNLQFGDVAVFFNEQERNHIADLAPRADDLDIEIVEDVVVTHADSGIKILAAPPRPELAESVSGDQFSTLVQFFRTIYPYIVIDAPSTLNEIGLSAFDVSDLILLVTTQDIPAIRNARMFLDLVPALELDKRRILFVMNNYDKRIGITPEKVGESFKTDDLAVLPYDRRTLVPSINRGVPFMLTDKNKSQPIGRAMINLAEIVRHRLVIIEGQMKEQLETAQAIKR
jgi:pilus assembly protein CpaE